MDRLTTRWLLWDGDCALCRCAVAWVIGRDRRHAFIAMPYQQAPSPPMTPELYRRCREAVQVLRSDGQSVGGGAAVALVLCETGYPRLGRVLTWKPIAPLVQLAYRIIAGNRALIGRLFFSRQCSSSGNEIR